MNSSRPSPFSDHLFVCVIYRVVRQVLLEQGADVETKDAENNTALHLAVEAALKQETLHWG